MKCFKCKGKLPLGVTLRGEGVCSHCNQKQMIAKKYTFAVVVSIVMVFLIFGLSLISILASLAFGSLYLIISKTEPIQSD